MEKRVCTCGGTYAAAWIACLLRVEPDGNRYMPSEGYHCARCGHTLVDEAVSEVLARAVQDPKSAETFLIPRTAFTGAPGKTEVLAGVA